MIDVFLGDRGADDWRMYSPVLRAKASEWKALESISPGVRHRIAPIVEFIPDWKTPGANTSGSKRRAPQTPAEYVARMLDALLLATPNGTRSFVYFGLADPAAKWFGIDLWNEYAVRVPAVTRMIPLVDLSSVSIAANLPAAVKACGELGVRLNARDIGPQLSSRIATAIRPHGLSRAAIHIVVDLKDVPTTSSHLQIRTALENANEFASIVVLAGVFPTDLTQYQPGVTAEPRTEWTTWWHNHLNTAAGDRILAFGDFTTQCAHYQLGPEVPGSVSLRYTIDDAVLVFRGRQSNSSTGLGHDQIHGHCRLLVKRTDYDGAAFSSGDHRINCWTDPANGTGNAMQWRTASLVHHLTHVVAQLQDPIGSTANARTSAGGQPAAPCQ